MHSLFILEAPMLEQLPFSCCMYASHLLKSLGYFSRACSMLAISLAESMKNKVTTSSAKLGLASSCKSST
uniref:Uncharacterized protein n=1 Tax=Arundo donax TaxID=35708 RepID=A0A0A9GQ76_ARUDO